MEDKTYPVSRYQRGRDNLPAVAARPTVATVYNSAEWYAESQRINGDVIRIYSEQIWVERESGQALARMAFEMLYLSPEGEEKFTLTLDQFLQQRAGFLDEPRAWALREAKWFLYCKARNIIGDHP